MFPMIVRIDVDSFQVPVRMSWFGAETQKPMVLYTNAKWLEDLRFMKTSDSAPQGALYVLKPDNTTGELRPTGSRDLKSSQAYPEEFGHAVAKLWAKYRRGLRRVSTPDKACCCDAECPPIESVLSAPVEDGEDAWEDASLVNIFQTLQAAALRANPDAIVEKV